MKRLKAAFLWWFFGKVEDPVGKEITPTEAYQAGFANGSACGELRGRNAAINELEIILASKAKTEFEAEDVATVKYRTIH